MPHRRQSGRVCSVSDEALLELGRELEVDALLARELLQLLGEPLVERVPVVLVDPLALHQIVPAR